MSPTPPFLLNLRIRNCSLEALEQRVLVLVIRDVAQHLIGKMRERAVLDLGGREF